MGLSRCLWSAVLILIAASGATAQGTPSEKHVTELLAEYKQKYPDGPSDSTLCKRARDQHPPYSSFRIREVDQATLAKDLRALMQRSDEVVLVGLAFRNAEVLTPSGEDAVTYTDVRVLRVWKGFYRVGDLLTLGFWEGLVHCGENKNEFTGTQIGPVPASMFYTRNPAYAPGGPYVLFLQKDKTGEIQGLRLAGDGAQGMFDLSRPPNESAGHPRFSACFSASFDPIACREYLDRTHGKLEPEWCRDPRVDQENIAKCNAELDTSGEEMVASGLERDPVRKQHNGMPIGSFLNEVQSVADSLSKPSTAAADFAQ